jgi:hypothetical protein
MDYSVDSLVEHVEATVAVAVTAAVAVAEGADATTGAAGGAEAEAADVTTAVAVVANHQIIKRTKQHHYNYHQIIQRID